MELYKYIQQNIENADEDQLKRTINLLKKELILRDQKLKTWNRITDSDNWIDMSEVAKTLHTKHKKYKKYGRNLIFSFLRDAGILRQNNQPMQHYCDREYFKVIEVEKDFGYETKIIPKTMISPKGIDFIRRLLDETIN